jgi:MFS family permease
MPLATRRVGLPREIWLLLGGNLLVRAAGFAYPFMTYHVAAQGYGAGTVGAVLAVFGIGSVAGHLLCGSLVDRLGRRSTIVMTMLLAAVVLALMSGARSVPDIARRGRNDRPRLRHAAIGTGRGDQRADP